MKLNLVALAILLMAALTARSQNHDWIITAKGDTTPCKISYNFFSNWYRYSLNDSSSKKRIKGDEIREFYIADKKIWFRKIYTDNKHYALMQVLERGKISLYQTQGSYANNGGTYNMWFATKNCDTGIYIKTDMMSIISGTKKGKKAFVTYLDDNKPVQDKYIADNNPDIDEIQRLVRWYNTGELFKQPASKKNDDSAGFNPNQN